MKNFTYLSLLLLLISSCGSVEKYNAEILELHSPAELREDIDKTYSLLKKAHPKLYQYISQERLDFKFDSLKTAMNTPLTSYQFYNSIAPVVKTIGQGHIGMAAPSLKRTKEEKKYYKNKKFNFNSIQFENVEDRIFVTGAKGVDSVLIGAELIKLEDETPQRLIEKYKKNVASDGYNTTLQDRFIASRLTRYYYNEYGVLDTINATFKKKGAVINKMFKWEKKVSTQDSLIAVSKDSLAALNPVKLTKVARKIKRDSIKVVEEYKATHGYNSDTDTYNRMLSFIGKDSIVAYMKIRGFTNADYKTFYEEAFKEIDSVKATDLIIDLRDNTGGRVVEINELFGYMTDKEYIMYNESETMSRTPVINYLTSNTNPLVVRTIGVVLSPFLLTHNLIKTKKRDGKLFYKLKGVKPLKPKENNFKGKVYVLINGSSFSASSVFSTNMKRDKRAIFVGQETGGSHNGTVAGMMRGYEMPNSKVKIKMGMLQVESPYKVEPDGYGVMPDVEIIPTIADREAGIDPEIEWVLKDIESKK